MDSLKDALGLGDPYHIGVAVRDLVEAMPRFHQLLGLGPWGRIDAEVPAVFRGAETVSGVRSAFARLGSMYVELVEPTAGDFPASIKVLSPDANISCAHDKTAGLRRYRVNRMARLGLCLL